MKTKHKLFFIIDTQREAGFEIGVFIMGWGKHKFVQNMRHPLNHASIMKESQL